jgi:hypothetical protein
MGVMAVAHRARHLLTANVPNPGSNYSALYPKSDGQWYTKGADDVELQLVRTDDPRLNTDATPIQDSGWIGFPFATGYSQGAPGEVYVPEYRKVGNRVSMRGIVKWNAGSMAAAGNYALGTLPVGFRPTRYAWKSAATHTASPARLIVAETGTVSVVPLATAAYVAIDIDFYID